MNTEKDRNIARPLDWAGDVAILLFFAIESVWLVPPARSAAHQWPHDCLGTTFRL